MSQIHCKQQIILTPLAFVVLAGEYQRPIFYA